MASLHDPLSTPRRRVHATLVMAFIVPLVAATAIAACLLVGVARLMSATEAGLRLDREIQLLHRFEKLMIDMETGIRGYLVTGDELFLEPYDEARRQFDDVYAEVEPLLVREQQVKRVRNFRADVTHWMEYAQALIRMRAAHDPQALSVPMHADGKRMMDALRNQIATIATVAESLRDEQLRASRESARLMISLGVLLLFLSAIVTAGVSYRRIRRVASDYERAAEEQFQDSLTGLLNRRGFFTLARQQALLASRASQSLWLYCFDLNGLKKINDRFGHQMGSQAIIDFSNILVQTFRSSDTLARVGGDEFAVLAVHHTAEDTGVVKQRLESNLEVHNARANRPYQLGAALGVIGYDPNRTLEQALHEADVRMYEVKRAGQLTRAEDEVGPPAP